MGSNNLKFIKNLIRGHFATDHEHDFQKDSMKGVLLFVGFARTGSTLVGAILNSHPDVVISNELNLVKYVQYGVPLDGLLSLVLKHDREFAEAGYEWTGYDYSIPNTNQGSITNLRYFGDKKAAENARRLYSDPGLLEKIGRSTGLPVSLIHVTRNPFDLISTQSVRSGVPIDELVVRFSKRCRMLEEVLARGGYKDYIKVTYEQLKRDPVTELTRLLHQLSLESDGNFVERVSDVIDVNRKSRRATANWDTNSTNKINDCIQQYSFLEAYHNAEEST